MVPEVSKFLEAAIRYAQQGWFVFPIRANAKQPPLTPHGCRDASKNLDQVRRWWARYADANIGVATGAASGIVVLDIDAKNGKSGHQSFGHTQQFGPFRTLVHTTPNGGLHVFFKHPAIAIRNRVDLLPGIDVRGDGGYVLLPPSVVEGRRYAALSYPDGELAVLPEPLLALLREGEWSWPEPSTVYSIDVPIDERITDQRRISGILRRQLKAIVAMNTRLKPPVPWFEGLLFL
jgi:hypothetical protein